MSNPVWSGTVECNNPDVYEHVLEFHEASKGLHVRLEYTRPRLLRHPVAWWRWVRKHGRTRTVSVDIPTASITEVSFEDDGRCTIELGGVS